MEHLAQNRDRKRENKKFVTIREYKLCSSRWEDSATSLHLDAALDLKAYSGVFADMISFIEDTVCVSSLRLRNDSWICPARLSSGYCFVASLFDNAVSDPPLLQHLWVERCHINSISQQSIYTIKYYAEKIFRGCTLLWSRHPVFGHLGASGYAISPKSWFLGESF